MPNLGHIIRERHDYGIWALNALTSHYAVSTSLPLRIVRQSAISESAIDNAQRTYFSDCLVDASCRADPLKLLDALSGRAAGQSFEQLANAYSPDVFLSAGAYSNPVFTLIRRSPAWRLSEIASVQLKLARMFRADRDVTAFSFDGQLSDYFFMVAARLKQFDGIIVAGPCWRWHSPDDNGRAIGREITGNGVRLFLDAFTKYEFNVAKQGAGGPPKSIARSREQLLRLGSVRAAIAEGDAIERLEKIVASFEMASRIELSGFPSDGNSIEVKRWLETTKMGVNHWQGAAVLTSVLSREQFQATEVPEAEGRTFYYYPPSLHESKCQEQRLTYVGAIADESMAWRASFSRLNYRDKHHRDESGRVLLPKESTPGRFTATLSTALSKKVDRNHTNRHHYLDERISLLRYQISDLAAELVSTYSGLGDQDENNRFKGLTGSRIRIQLPERFASNIAYSLGADVCRIYRFDHTTRRLYTIQSHYGPVILNGENPRTFDEIETSYILQSASNKVFRRKCMPYLVVDNLVEDEMLGEVRGVCLNDLPSAHCAWPASLPDDVIGGSAIGVPIEIFGRTWGVVEVRGRYPRQLRQSTQVWLGEIARMIGASLFNEWINEHLSQLTLQAGNLLRSHDVTGDNIFQIVATTLSSMFLCESCLIWYQHPNDREGVKVQGGVITSSDGDVWPDVKKEHADHIVKSIERIGDGQNGSLLKTFLNSGKRFAQFDLNETNESWSYAPICAHLRRLEQTQICLLRLEDDNGRPFGAIWLTGHLAFQSAWKQLFSAISSHVKLIFDIALGRHNLLSNAQITLAHEASTALRAITRDNEEILNRLEPLVGKRPEELAKLLAALRLMVEKAGGFGQLKLPEAQVQFGELEGILARSRRHFAGRKYSVEIREAGRRIEHQSNRAASHVEDLMRGRIHEVEYQSRAAVNFLRILNAQIDLGPRYALPSRFRSGAPVQAPVWSGPKSEIAIVFPRQEADFIISNLISNAIKYNVGRKPPRVGYRNLVDHDRSKHTFSFKNIGWVIEDQELDRIFEFSGRGKRADEFWPNEGFGAGLAGVVYRLNRVSESNPHINASLKGPFQRRIEHTLPDEINLKHNSIELYQAVNAPKGLDGLFAEIEFVLEIENIGRVNESGVIL